MRILPEVILFPELSLFTDVLGTLGLLCQSGNSTQCALDSVTSAGLEKTLGTSSSDLIAHV